MLIKRTLAGKFANYLKLFPVVAIIGPRHAGKATFAKTELPDWNYFDLEKISDFNRIETEIEFFLKIAPKAVHQVIYMERHVRDCPQLL